MVFDEIIYLNRKNETENGILYKDDNRIKFTLVHEIGQLSNDILPHFNEFKEPIIDDYTTLETIGFIL